MRKLRSFKDPYGVQRFLDDTPYHLADTAWSPRRVLREQTSHCLEGAIFAAAAMRVLGFPPLLIDFEAENDTDHVLALFRYKGHWGAVAKSNYSGCRYREPVYRSLRELAMSYFNIYFNMRGERTLRNFSRPVNLTRFDHLGLDDDRRADLVHTELLVRDSSLQAAASRNGQTPSSRRQAALSGRDSRKGAQAKKVARNSETMEEMLVPRKYLQQLVNFYLSRAAENTAKSFVCVARLWACSCYIQWQTKWRNRATC